MNLAGAAAQRVGDIAPIQFRAASEVKTVRIDPQMRRPFGRGGPAHSVIILKMPLSCKDALAAFPKFIYNCGSTGFLCWRDERNSARSSLIAGLCCDRAATNFYVDSKSGSENAPGTSPETAWKTLDQVNTHVFQPGDQLLFRAGTRYVGQLKPQGSGRESNGKVEPIMIGKYGDGPLPRIDGEGRVLDTLLLRNVEFWEVQDLEISNLGTNRAPWRTGVRIECDGFGTMRHIHLRRLFVHDVNGDLRKSHEGCGIFFDSTGGNDSHFDDLLIEDCHVVRTDRNGICQRSGRGPRSLHVVIRGNLLEDIGGDGIKLWGSNGGLIESNTVHGGRMRCEDYAAGIWPFACDDTVIQFNEVSGMKGTKDGEGFDSDYLCRRSLFQYNYSHDNDGGFILICGPGNSYNEDTVIRYNISQNDGADASRVFHFGGKATGTKVYNNTVYVGPDKNLPLLLFTEWNKGWASNTVFENNIFYAIGTASCQPGQSADTVFSSNLFYGNFTEFPEDGMTNTNRPPLVNPGTGNDGFDSLNGYEYRSDITPPRGVTISSNGGRDFFGDPVPGNRPPCIGAAEATGSR